jgi:hypothetical protein
MSEEMRIGKQMPVVVLALSVGLSAALTQGCASFSAGSGREAVRVVLLPGGAFRLEGRTVRLRDLPQGLRSLGANSGTSIIVSVPPQTPATTISRVTSELASFGFPRIVFMKPRRAKASTTAASGRK